MIKTGWMRHPFPASWMSLTSLFSSGRTFSIAVLLILQNPTQMLPSTWNPCRSPVVINRWLLCSLRGHWITPTAASALPPYLLPFVWKADRTPFLWGWVSNSIVKNVIGSWDGYAFSHIAAFSGIPEHQVISQHHEIVALAGLLEIMRWPHISQMKKQRPRERLRGHHTAGLRTGML